MNVRSIFKSSEKAENKIVRGSNRRLRETSW